MKVDFSKLLVQFGFEDETVLVDIRKELGNAIRRSTADIGLDEVARQIYFSNGEIDIPNEYIDSILDVSRGFIVPIQESIKSKLKK